jgi:predicted esterase
MNPAIKRPLVVPAVSRHTATIIMAHGLGDSGAGWVDLAENWRRREKFNEVKFIFPNAPTIPITAVSASWKGIVIAREWMLILLLEWRIFNAWLV